METAVFYVIIANDSNEELLSGILRDSEDKIYPSQDIDSTYDLPYECEAHHFQSKDTRIEMWNIEIPRSIIMSQRPK